MRKLFLCFAFMIMLSLATPSFAYARSGDGGFYVLGFFILIIILAWAYTALSDNIRKEVFQQLTKDFESKLAKENYKLNENYMKKQDELQKTYKKYTDSLNDRENEIRIKEKLFDEKFEGFPFVAEAYSVYSQKKFDTFEKYCLEKKNPSPKSAEIIRDLKREVKNYQKNYFIYKGIAEYYESLVPDLEEFKNPPQPIEPTSLADGEDIVDTFLDSSERLSLTREEKFQKALDRYWKRKKTNWEIGRDYERYIGYEYEKDGWDVTFFGAVKGLEDMGRDLICKKNKSTVHIVQCKYWAADKIIHEKHIFQLFGTCIAYQVEHGVKPIPVFVTSTKLSDLAKSCAEILGVEVRQEKKFSKFPSIKCNVGREGDKIYHLPFDQQYDKIKIEPHKGERYCLTIDEAEQADFRRAYRWHG